MNELSAQSLAKPFDPTGSTSISGAALAQFGDGLQPYLDKGLIIVTEDVNGVPVVPDARDGQGKTIWQRFGWVRVQANTASLYVWSKNSANDAVYFKWVLSSAANIPDLSITTSKYGFQSVTDDKIASVNWNKLIGVAPTLSPSGAAGGDLTGNYPNPTIAGNAIDSSKLKSDAVSANRAVTGLHVQDHTLPLVRLAVNGTALTVPLGAADLSGFVESPLPLLQFLATTVGTANTTAVMALNADPLITDGTGIITLSITPKSATSLIKVTLTGMMTGSFGTAVAQGVIAVFFGNTLKAAKFATISFNTAAPPETMFTIEAIFVSGTTAATNVSVRVGTTNAATTLYVNQGNAGGTTFGGTVNKGILTIQEIQGTLS